MNAPLKLGILITHPIQYYTPLFRELAARTDVDLHVFYCGHATPDEQSAAGFGVAFDWDVPLLDGYKSTFLKNVAARPSTTSFWGMDVPEIANWIGGGRFDALLINGWNFKGAWQAMAACWRQGTPILLRSDSHLLTSRSPLKSMAKRLAYPRFLRRADGCVATGQLARQYFLHYGASANRVFVVPHSIDDERIGSEARRWANDRVCIRNSWQVKPSDIAYLFVGKFVEKKRPLDFMQIISILNRENGRTVGVMVGDGPLRGVCEAHARKNRIPIRFVGFLNQSEIVRAYVGGNALILPSSGGETWGLVVNEAMVCGLPCFVSDQVGCGPDLIEEGATGGIFPLDNPAQWAKGLRAYADPSVLAHMGAAARSHSGEFSVRVVAGRLLRAVTETVRQSRGPRRYTRLRMTDQRSPVQETSQTGA